eukprot:m.845173 g.845173  ORF g.845173 m.845173 type:complete len:186 (+) comp23477_c1_seq6:250-807(+)
MRKRTKVMSALEAVDSRDTNTTDAPLPSVCDIENPDDKSQEQHSDAPPFKLRVNGYKMGVGTAVIITSKNHPNCVVLGVRKNAEGAGTYALPGGHLEYGEDILTCGVRETKEETGLNLYNVTAGPVLNAVNRVNFYHYLVGHDAYRNGQLMTQANVSAHSLGGHNMQSSSAQCTRREFSNNELQP